MCQFMCVQVCLLMIVGGWLCVVACWLLMCYEVGDGDGVDVVYVIRVVDVVCDGRVGDGVGGAMLCGEYVLCVMW